MTRPLAFAVGLVSGLSLVSVAAAAGIFSDVPSDHWAVDSIEWANEMGLMTGPADRPGTFDPAGTVNRAQLATVLSREDANLRAEIAYLQQRIAALEAKVGTHATSSSSSSSSVSSVSSSSVSSSSSSVASWTETNSTWRDADQAIIKIELGKLYRSTNNGSTWKEMSPQQWISDTGTWYRFDDKLNLNQSEDGKRWISVPERQWVAYGVTYWLDFENRVWRSE